MQLKGKSGCELEVLPLLCVIRMCHDLSFAFNKDGHMYMSCLVDFYGDAIGCHQSFHNRNHCKSRNFTFIYDNLLSLDALGLDKESWDHIYTYNSNCLKSSMRGELFQLTVSANLLVN